MLKTAVDALHSMMVDGLTEEILVNAIRRGETARDNTTIFDPPPRGGYDAWAETTRALREDLCPRLNWRPDDTKNFCRVVSPSGVAIVVASGSPETGDLALNPTTKQAKGSCTQMAVESNQLVMPFMGQSGSEQNEQTWILLVHRDVRKEEVRAELSLPELINESGYITKWGHRSILATINLNPSPASGGGFDDRLDDSSIDVPVTRRG